MVVLSLFDGMSCGQIALKELGVNVSKYYASEVDRFAIEQTQLNFPDTIQLGDVTKWENWDIDWSKVDLVMGGSPCFVAGTNILTKDGYKPIEQIKVGDYVLTHRNRYRKVLQVGDKVSPTVMLKAQGVLATETTRNHPYYIRQMSREWDKSKRTYKRVFSKPKWVDVGAFTKGDFLGVPILSNSTNANNINKEDAYILGCYLADGHTRKDYRVSEGRPQHRHWQLILSIGESKLEDIKSNITYNYSLYKHSKSTYRCVLSNKRLVLLAEQLCGCGAGEKVISQPLLDLPKNLLKEVLRGYFDGDGSYRNGVYRAITVSRNLAQSLCLAVSKCYSVNANIGYTRRPDKCVIEGRLVNQRDIYTVTFRKEMRKQSNAEVIDGVIWYPIKSVKDSGRSTKVYNIEVEDDNSYIANNAIVHNCQGFSFAGEGLAFDDPRSALFFDFVDIVNHTKKHNPKIKFLLENVMMAKRHIAVINDYMGLFPVEINSSLVSAQNRVRLYWSNIKTIEKGLFGELHTAIPQPKDRGIVGYDILDDNMDTSMCVNHSCSDVEIHYDNNYSRLDALHPARKLNIPFENRSRVYYLTGKLPALLAQDTGFVGKYLFGGDVYRLSPTECARLQTIPDWYKWDCSDTQQYKMLGNGWTVEVIKHIFSYL